MFSISIVWGQIDCGAPADMMCIRQIQHRCYLQFQQLQEQQVSRRVTPGTKEVLSKQILSNFVVVVFRFFFFFLGFWYPFIRFFACLA